jgi:hypothetical protein
MTLARLIDIADIQVMPHTKIAMALDVIFKYGQIEGDHHRAWVIDQVVRELTGNHYKDFIDVYCEHDGVPNAYEWNEGIAP